MKKNDCFILGAGFTGLSAGISSEHDVYEACSMPGGICASYYINTKGKKTDTPIDKESYRFEVGGGHWIFGTDKKILQFINSMSKVKKYERNSSVYLSDYDTYIPFPIQNHLSYLPKKIKENALDDILHRKNKAITTLSDWLESNFGRTLCEIFFFPFHELYTAGLYKDITPQDKFKTPVDKNLILKGAKKKTPQVGYNAVFVYPKEGLDDLIRKMAGKCRLYLNKKVVKIDLSKKEVIFEDGNALYYKKIISTLPLNKVIEMTGVNIGKQDPYTSVLVVNIGARKGKKCPPYHWLYIPKSRTGFYRVGFYSNVDKSFLPKGNNRVSIYVEKAYRAGCRLKNSDIKKVSDDIIKELKEWEYIDEVEVVDPTWIEIAYTWNHPDSSWRQKSIEFLSEHQIYQTGRYGKWKFQGIAESIKDGLDIGRKLNE